MRILLDTHTFYWWVFERGRLSKRALAHCVEPGNDVFLSIASVWELQIKNQLGKLVLESPLDMIVHEQVEKNGLQVLPIELKHVLGLNTLPLHHRDPFDRILIAQARSEGVTLVTCDPVIQQYDVPILW